MQCDRKSERLGLLKAARDLTLLPELGRARRDALMDTFPGWNTRYRPFAFTEHGAVMAATVLNSQQAVQMSILIVRAFVELRVVVEQQSN